MLKRILPDRLRKLRTLRGLSQAELARKAGVAPATLNALEAGQNPNPEIWTLLKLSIYLQVSLDYLLGFDKVDSVILTSRLDMSYPLVTLDGEKGKCYACDGILIPGVPHERHTCLVLNEQRGPHPELLAGFYGLTLEEFFEDLRRGEQEMRIKW